MGKSDKAVNRMYGRVHFDSKQGTSQGSALLLSGWVTACVMPKLALVWPWCS